MYDEEMTRYGCKQVWMAQAGTKNNSGCKQAQKAWEDVWDMSRYEQ